MKAQDLIDFEQEIACLYEQGKIKYPVHLRLGRENKLVEIFKDIKPEDYVYGYWDSHELALLKGVPREVLRQAILEGHSIALSFPEYRLLCSGIVGSLCGVAAGTAWEGYKTWHFCGDMTAETGIFHESVKYACNHDLPVTFVVGDNGLSVMTDTRKVWGNSDPWFIGTKYMSKIIYFKYKNGYPHSGLGWRIKF